MIEKILQQGDSTLEVPELAQEERAYLLTPSQDSESREEQLIGQEYCEGLRTRVADYLTAASELYQIYLTNSGESNGAETFVEQCAPLYP
jgi:hypothetical protein